jgi:hypothetical protein
VLAVGVALLDGAVLLCGVLLLLAPPLSVAVPAVTKTAWPSRLPSLVAVLAGVGELCGPGAATPAQAAAPATTKAAAANLAQTRPYRLTSRITRMLVVAGRLRR